MEAEHETEGLQAENQIELDVAKFRNGRTGVVDVRFDKETVSFSDWVDPSVGNDITGTRAE